MTLQTGHPRIQADETPYTWNLPALVILGVLSLLCLPLVKPPFEINGDTSWLIHVAEQMLSGAQVYVDVIETNPPMAFLLYTPAAWLAGVTGISPERLVYLQTALIAGVSVSLCGVIARSQLGLTGWALVLLLVTIAITFLLVPSRSFTQREHLAVMLTMPAVLCLAGRSEGAVPTFFLAFSCGVLAGLAASIKPHFIMVIALPAVVAAVQQRSVRPLFVPETLTAATIVALYGAVWLLAFPAFFDVPLFLTRNAYLLYTYQAADYLKSPELITLYVIVVLSVGSLIAGKWRPAIVVLASGVAAFVLAFMIQNKGFAYHLYPVAALGIILAAFAAVRRSSLALVALAGLAACAFVSAVYSERYPATADLRRAILAEKARPSLIIFTFDIAVNFPLVRQIDAVWASRLVSTWASNSAGHVIRRGATGDQLGRTRQVIALERTWFAEDVTRNRPEILVFDGETLRNDMLSHDGFRAAFDGHYRMAGTAEDGRFLLYRRIER